MYAEVGNVESRYYYTGADIAITPVITDYNGNVLPADDYDTVLKRGGEEVAAANELGSYTCTFTGKGDYKDSITFDFEVVTQPAPTLQATDLKETTARLCWEDESAATNWVVEYGTDDTFTEKQSIPVAGTPSVTLDIRPETTYYARVKSVIGAVESEWSASVPFAFSDKRTIDGETHDTAGLPSKLNYGYTLSQQIYTSEELGSEAVITSVGFFLQSDEESDPVVRQLELYLLPTEDETFTESHWIPYTEDDKVFSGAASFRVNNWTDIALDTPFAYNGANNVAVIVFDRTGVTAPAYSFRTFGTDEPMSNYCFADSAFDPSSDNDKYLLNNKSVTRLGVQNPIAVDENISNGSLSADKDIAAAGEIVTLDVQPAENYEIGEVGFTDGDGYHQVTPEDGVYSFTMPNSFVTVTATFNKITYSYVDGFGKEREPVSEYTVVKEDTTELTDGFWIVNSRVTNNNRLTVSGNVKLILCDGAELAAPKGVTVNYDYENENTNLTIVGSICVDCSSGQIDPMTNAFIQISGVFAELELRIIRDRVRSGMANARAKGRKIGRPHITADDIPASFLRHYPAFKAGKMNLSELARICGLSRTTAYKYIGLLEG